MMKFRIAMLSAVLLAAWTIPGPACAQPGSGSFSRAELAQLLAPIALYPDPLLSQILMASTYPGELQEADEWLRQYPGLDADRLNAALLDQPWDPSVKSLCHYPAVLSEMVRNMDNTARLGEAFLTEQAEVTDVIQELRRRAQDAGSLASGSQQSVTDQGGYILVEPAAAGVVYVPYYDPLTVYGSWWYPAYQPLAWFPGYYPRYGVVFAAGVVVGIAITDWSRFDFHRRSIVVNPYRVAPFNRGVVTGAPAYRPWVYETAHRRGYGYTYGPARQRYGQPGTAATPIPRGPAAPPPPGVAAPPGRFPAPAPAAPPTHVPPPVGTPPARVAPPAAAVPQPHMEPPAVAAPPPGFRGYPGGQTPPAAVTPPPAHQPHPEGTQHGWGGREGSLPAANPGRPPGPPPAPAQGGHFQNPYVGPGPSSSGGYGGPDGGHGGGGRGGGHR
ncbi:DUF3300 domain-containing protein [Fundidesulfovibrio agrisoli]|uniref:DUF3300 domain-containing protein n=1 Tax=Fundidesulfovibrio agrisoli TaxID=2922717 RepID=UPI001FADB8D1|nr:DUF3300 domain-containing protein [Fundidesulfovibrio agrisoli]